MMAGKKHSAEVYESVQGLIATGLYKSKSQAVRTQLQKLGSQHPPGRSLAELRHDLDQKLTDISLSQTVRDIREHEMH